MSTITQSDYDNAYNEYCRQNITFTKDRCGEVLKNILYSNAATYANMDYGLKNPRLQDTQFFNCLKGIIGKGFGETVDPNDKLHIETLTRELFKSSTTYETMYDLYNGIYLRRESGYYEGWFSSPLVQTAYFMLQARERRLLEEQQQHAEQQQQQQYGQQQQQYGQQQQQQHRAEKLRKLQELYRLNPQYQPFTSKADRIAKWWALHEHNMQLAQQLYGADLDDLDDLVRQGGSRSRKTAHKKRKSYRKSKSKRVRQTRRKQSRRHRHSRRRHHR